MKQQFSMITLLAPVLLAAVLAPSSAFAQQTPQYPGPYMWHGWFFVIVFIAVTVVVVVTLLRWLGAKIHSASPHTLTTKSPVDILEERFARGEIDKDEFEEQRRLLDG